MKTVAMVVGFGLVVGLLSGCSATGQYAMHGNDSMAIGSAPFTQMGYMSESEWQHYADLNQHSKTESSIVRISN